MRKDGKRVTDADPIYTIFPYILKYRYDSMNMIEIDIPLAPMQTYLNEKRKQGYRFSHLGLVLAAYVRTAAEYPLMNRFIVNKRIYQRNEFSVAMVVLKPGKLDETMSKMYFNMEDDIFAVHETMDKYIGENRAEGDTNATDNIVRTLLKIPGLLSVAAGVLKWMDLHGMLPGSLIKASPFHASMTISNLASIRTNHIFHHVYEFGTTSLLITLGNMREVPVRKGEEIVFERSLPMGIVMDERIGPGAYFSAVFHRFKQYIAIPSLLEGPPKVVNTKFE
jgi:hypothetical protein